MRFAQGCLVIFLLVTASPAQQPSIGEQEAARARLLLHSSQWVEKAWGAYFAGRLHSPDLAVDIVDELRASSALSATRSNEEWAFLDALFDAAIESGGQVPAAVLEPFERSWSEPVLILLALSRDRDREGPLLRMSDTGYDLAWTAANNLLYGLKSRKWYGRILGELRITQRLTVIDPDGVPPTLSAVAGGTCGDGMSQIPKGLPPITLYSLQSTRRVGLVLLAPGPVDVYYGRTVVPTDQQGGVGSCSSINREKVRIGYLAGLAKMPSEEAEKLFHREAIIRYEGVEQFQREVQLALESQEQGIRSLFQKIQQQERLSSSSVALEIVPEVDGHRRDRTAPLSTVGPKAIALN